MSRNITAGFAICGSFCTFSKVLPCLEGLVQSGMNVIPILSQNAATMDTRFFKAQDFTDRVRMICQRELITTIPEAEPIGPKKLLDILVIAPCTGNTLGKLANGITDTPVTMATKSHLRNGRPVLIGVSTNDALGISARRHACCWKTQKIFTSCPCGRTTPRRNLPPWCWTSPASPKRSTRRSRAGSFAPSSSLEYQPIKCTAGRSRLPSRWISLEGTGGSGCFYLAAFMV